MKKMFALILAISVLIIAALAMTDYGIEKSYAGVVSPERARVAKFWIDKKYYEVDGKRYDMDAAPYIQEGRTMMPLRYLAYSLGVAEENVKWSNQSLKAVIKRGTEEIDPQVGRTVFGVNGWPVIGHFDVPPVLDPAGRVMAPYRTAAQALGALVFWDDTEQSVTVLTWKETPPPTTQTVKKVTVYKDRNYADVVGMDGETKRVETERPAMVTDVRDGGFTLDVIEWFKLWGVPESSMLYDPVRGGLAVRGASGDNPGKASGYVYFYKDEKVGWTNAYQKMGGKDLSKSSDNYIDEKGRFYSGNGAMNIIQNFYGKYGDFDGSNEVISVLLK